jgi:hypothetical protein
VRRALLLGVAALALGGCSAVTHGSPLSSVPARQPGIFITTGSSPVPYYSLGFVQVRGYGVQVVGYVELGHATLDAPIRTLLASEAARMGGNGVIHVEFLDENPSTEFERIQAVATSAQNLATGKAGLEKKERYVTVTGEVVRFAGSVR